MGFSTQLQIQKEWCRYWVRTKYGFRANSALVLILTADREDKPEVAKRELAQALREIRWNFAVPTFIQLHLEFEDSAARVGVCRASTMQVRDGQGSDGENSTGECSGGMGKSVREIPHLRLDGLIESTELVSNAEDLCAWMCAADSLVFFGGSEFGNAKREDRIFETLSEVAYGIGRPLNRLGGQITEESSRRQEVGEAATSSDPAADCIRIHGGAFTWESVHQPRIPDHLPEPSRIGISRNGGPDGMSYEEGRLHLQSLWKVANQSDQNDGEAGKSNARKVA